MPDIKLKTWIEVSKSAVRHNFRVIKSLLKPKTKLWAVVKSNAYGHGLLVFAKLANEAGVDGFCVDSVIEGMKLRDNGIKKPILVLGPTLPDLFLEAFKNDIAITVSSPESLAALAKSKYKPNFHLKIDTGMHRQGFYVEDLPKTLRTLKLYKLSSLPTGSYTHFSSAKDLNYPTFTDLQFHTFKKALEILAKAGYANIIRHAAATGGTLVSREYDLDAVRIGIGLYGLWPSKELELQINSIKFKPVLSWRALVSEVKNLKPGDYVGYDLAERVYENKKMAVVPIGYWHGFPRSLSSVGEVLIGGKRAKVLGRVSMDLLTVDVTSIPCKVGDIATIIGKDAAAKAGQGAEISAYELAQKTNSSHYEIITRINPLIERVVAS